MVFFTVNELTDHYRASLLSTINTILSFLPYPHSLYNILDLLCHCSVMVLSPPWLAVKPRFIVLVKIQSSLQYTVLLSRVYESYGSLSQHHLHYNNLYGLYCIYETTGLWTMTVYACNHPTSVTI